MDIIKIANEALLYNSETGVFTWKLRPLSHFPDLRSMRIWNTKYAGKIAGRSKTNKNGKTYRYITLMNRSYMAHRIAWGINYGRLPTKQIDHIDGCGTNNRISNLRDVSGHENHRNMKLFKNNKTGIPGVYKHSQANVWVSTIQVESKKVNLGCHKTFFEACCARKSAENDYGFHLNHGSRRSL